MSAPVSQPPRVLRIFVFNDSEDTLSLLSAWFETRGHRSVTANISEMRRAHIDAPAMLLARRPDVVVMDLARPYVSNWDFLQYLKAQPSLRHLPFVETTPNKDALTILVGDNTAEELIGNPEDLTALLRRVEAAARPTE